MHFTALLLVAASAALTSAQDVPSLAAALSTTDSLSAFNTLIGDYPQLLGTLANSTNITIFAPNNDAIEKLRSSPGFDIISQTPGAIEAILQYHVVNASLSSANFSSSPLFVETLQTNETWKLVSGGQRIGLVLNGEGDAATPQVLSGFGTTVNVTQADVVVSTGYVHIIDGPLRLPERVSTTALAAGLTALAGALGATSLTSTVDTTKDVTIFAPSNAAFAAIGSALGTLDVATLSSILQYHVVAGTVAYSSSLSNGTQVKALSGQQLNVTIDEGEVFVNSARVIAANILVANGVVHLIDSVLNPNSTNVADPDDDDTSPVNFPGATSGAIPFTSGISNATITFAVTPTDAVLPEDYSTPQAAAATPTTTGGTASMEAAAAASYPTGAMGAAALLGGAAVLANF